MLSIYTAVHVCVRVCVCVDLKKAVTVYPSEGLLSSSPGQRSVTLTISFMARFVKKLVAKLIYFEQALQIMSLKLYILASAYS